MSALCGGIVTLMATNACGSSQTTWNPIDISEKDKAKIEVDTNNCDPKAVSYTHLDVYKRQIYSLTNYF